MRCLALTLAGVAQLLSVVDPNIFRKLIDGYAFKQGSRPQSEIAPAQEVCYFDRAGGMSCRQEIGVR